MNICQLVDRKHKQSATTRSNYFTVASKQCTCFAFPDDFVGRPLFWRQKCRHIRRRHFFDVQPQGIWEKQVQPGPLKTDCCRSGSNDHGESIVLHQPIKQSDLRSNCPLAKVTRMTYVGANSSESRTLGWICRPLGSDVGNFS